MFALRPFCILEIVFTEPVNLRYFSQPAHIGKRLED